MRTIRQDIIIAVGTTWQFTFTVYGDDGNLVDLTGYSARLSIREHFETGLRAHLSTQSDATHGTITLGGAAGTVQCNLSATETEDLVIDQDSLMVLAVRAGGKAPLPRTEQLMYDLEIDDGSGNVDRPFQGTITLTREVTRA